MKANRSLSQIRTVVFDWDDTLRTNHPHAHQFFCVFV
jgi:FMN phosphatase YigB (HAD superfamily)